MLEGQGASALQQKIDFESCINLLLEELCSRDNGTFYPRCEEAYLSFEVAYKKLFDLVPQQSDILFTDETIEKLKDQSGLVQAVADIGRAYFKAGIITGNSLQKKLTET